MTPRWYEAIFAIQEWSRSALNLICVPLGIPKIPNCHYGLNQKNPVWQLVLLTRFWGKMLS
jgi:hypothetical protein